MTLKIEENVVVWC